MNAKGKNILELLLEELKVKFTRSYTQKYYDEYNKNKSLFGISQMLFDYNVSNTAIRMKNKDELSSLKVPFVVNLKDGISIVKKYTKKEVYCESCNKKRKITIEDFKGQWDGIVLIAEKKENSIEPQYKENFKKQIYHLSQKYLFIICLISLFIIGIFTNNHYSGLGLILLSIVDLCGVYVGYLLVQKQLYIQNDHADRICSLFRKNGCNDVLNSSASKLWGIIGWSEVGLSYFISNTLISVLFPQLIGYLALINICALPYSFWSVWYQRFKVKQWCPLCLAVQISFWLIFIVNIIFNFISIPEFIVEDVFLAGIIYILPFLGISISLSLIMNEKRSLQQLQAVNDLRIKPEIFETLVKKQPRYNVDLSTSQIIWGNKDANILISIVTNPHCPPCAAMHKDIEKLLKKVGNMVGVQYIFSAYNEGLESSNKFLTAVHLSNISLEEKQAIFNEWFEKGKNKKEEFFKKYSFDMEDPKVIDEVNKHKEWKTRNNINGTPTVLINGYEFPYHYYRIDEIVHFTGLSI